LPLFSILWDVVSETQVAILLSQTSCLFSVKQKLPRIQQFLNNSKTNSENVDNGLLHNLWNLRGWCKRLPVCWILVLTHNFEMRNQKSAVAFVCICELWFQ
jgi:hypothetical protein